MRKGSVCRSGKRWFNTLSIGQRSAWSSLGASTVWINPIGNNYNPSGFNLYVRTNSLRDFYGLGWIDTAPALAVCIAYDKTFRYDPITGQLYVSLSTSTPDNYRSFYDISPPLRRTIYSYKDPYTFNVQGTGKVDLDLGAPGQFDEGDWINIRWRDMAADGSLSVPSYPFFLLEHVEPPETPLMITFTAQRYDASFWSGSLTDPLWQGDIPLDIGDPEVNARYVLPVPCRLRHISGQLYVEFIEGTISFYHIDIYKNGILFHELTIINDPEEGELYQIYESDITGKNFTAGDNLTIFISADGEEDWATDPLNMIVSVMLEIGNFS